MRVLVINMDHKHGNTGNQNASKGRDSVVRFRCARQHKAAWVKAAQAKGKTLTDWLTELANNSAKFD